MSVYTPESSLGWLDFDAVASERVATLLRSLEESFTVDVLGLGTIRDAFADMLSPGTSTVQTRLRYFMFLPWIFQRLEVEQVSTAEFARRLRDREAQLIDCLRHLGPDQGVIGYRAGRDLRRMPSEVYWGGLGAWGIRRLDMSIAEYGRWASAPRPRPERDNDGNTTERVVPMWAALPEPPKRFLSDPLTFDLEADEAQILIDGIRRRHPDTLIDVLSERPGLALDGIDYPWLVPGPELPRRLAEVMHHARCFSELLLGPQLVYNLLLDRQARKDLGWDKDARREGQIDRGLGNWLQLIDARHKKLSSWVDELPGFWHLLARNGATVGNRTKAFVGEVAEIAVNDPAGFAEDARVHSLIRDREVLLKSQRARLGNRSALENWNGNPVGGQFDYRWPVTKQYLTDFAAAAQPANPPGPTMGAERQADAGGATARHATAETHKGPATNPSDADSGATGVTD